MNSRPKFLLSRLFTGPRTRRGIFLFFLFGILLPAGFLGTLGFRSFQYERLLLRQQAEERHHAAADAIEQRAQELIQAPLHDLRQIAASPSLVSRDHMTAVRQFLSRDQLAGMAVDSMVWLDGEGRLLYPNVPGAARIPEETSPDWGPLSEDIERLEKLEFAEKKYAEALAGYQRLRKANLAPNLEAALLQNSMAAARRAGDTRTAEASALELINRFDRVRDATGVPFGVRGRQLLIKQWEAGGQKEKALRLRVDLVEGLIFQRWTDVPNGKDLVAEIATGANGRGGESSRRIHDALRQSELLQHRHHAATNFLQRAWPEVQKRLQARGWLDEGGVLRSKDRLPNPWIVALPLWDRTGGPRQGWLIASLPGRPFHERFEQEIKMMAQERGLDVSLEETAPGVTALSPGNFERKLASLDPAMVMRFYTPGAALERTAAQRRFWMYGSMVLLSLFVILVGFVLMTQAMYRESAFASLKTDFVANVSHELRTPLMTIRYIGERLQRGRYRSQDEVQELYGMLGEEAERLQQMIEEVLDFSRLLSGERHYDMEAIDLGQLVKEAVERMQTRAEAEGFAIEKIPPAADARIRADRKAALQAVTNLIDNAIKYSGDSRRVRVAAETSNGMGIVAVTDHGVGVKPEDQERIFEKFDRGSRPTGRGPKGVGLGLAMVKQIMESHGGRVNVASTPEQGTTFRLYFPVWKKEEPQT